MRASHGLDIVDARGCRHGMVYFGFVYALASCRRNSVLEQYLDGVTLVDQEGMGVFMMVGILQWIAMLYTL